MGLHKGSDKFFSISDDTLEATNQSWKFRWPNSADFNFNYYKLLADAQRSSIGKNNKPEVRIAIVGAGLAGFTAARELFRCGFTNIDIYEASNRIGGRTYSLPVDKQYTAFEMGAMRIPFFSHPGSRNSVVDYYRNLFGISTQAFPDPGSGVANTGIYLNDGYGPDPQNLYDFPRLDIWKKCQPGKKCPPPTKLLQSVSQKWSNFAEMVKEVFQEHYQQENWQEFWHKFVQHYWNKNFRELVYLEAIDKYDRSVPGFFGGLGMNEAEAQLFYTIGAGDGGWGAFYDISCLYPIRILLFGFGSNHQLIQGKFDGDGNFAPGTQYGKPAADNLGNPLASPRYLGVQTFAECLFYQPVNSQIVPNVSVYEASKMKEQYDVNLYTNNKVNKLERIDTGKIEVTSTHLSKTYDIVILTPTTWAWQMGIDVVGFDRKTQLPFDVTYSIKESHWISSSKVFYSLKERYWEKSPIPQLISTDTYLQGVYGYAIETKTIQDPGVLLVSYTWEDDANKLIAEADETLAQKCLERLDKLLLGCHNINEPISPYVNNEEFQVIHWAKEPSYRGCAKLYRESTWNEDYTLLKYNQKFSEKSNLYFAGEAFSVEGGWIEPAFRSALDTVIHVLNNTGGEFFNQFRYSDYPKYDDWHPSNNKPNRSGVFASEHD